MGHEVMYDSGQSFGFGSFPAGIEARYRKFRQYATICVFKSGVNICVCECMCVGVFIYVGGEVQIVVVNV